MMADLKLVKTRDISKVQPKANQLIMVVDGENGFDIYFDYSNTLRLHNSEGARLGNFVAGKSYIKNDICVYNSMIYRAVVDLKDVTFVNSHWQLLSGSSGGASGSNSSYDISYDGSYSGLEAITLQEAIDKLVLMHNEAIEEITITNNKLDQLTENVINIGNTVTDLEAKALTSDTQFVLDSF